MATRQDTFAGRTVASGWGTASDGNVWTTNAGDGQSVSGGEGLIISSSASTFNTLGTALSADTNTVVRWSVSDTSSTHGILARFQNTNQYYLCRYDGAGHIAFFKNVGGAKTTVTSVAFTPGVSNNFYWFRFIVQGSTIQIRHWADGASEPSTWDINTTDTSITAAGEGGLYGFNNFSGNDTFDSFSAADISTATPINLTGTLPSGAGLAGTLTVTSPSNHLTATLPSTASLSASLLISRRLGGAVVSGAGLSGVLSAGNPGTGIGDLTSSTGSIAWTGTSGSPGTGYIDTYTDSHNSGWELVSVPSYGGMPIANVRSVDNGVVTEEASLSTTQPGGHIHWLEQDSGGSWGGSEDPQFTRTELAPTGTLFRRYFQTTGTAPDVVGIDWTAWACEYPGDPGFVAYRFDLHNPTASAIALAGTDGIEIALIGSLQQNDATWTPASAGYGTLAGSDHVGWPSALTSSEPDYAYAIPTSGTTLGQATVKKTSLSGLGWSNLQVQYLQNTSRLKFKVQSDGFSVAAGATQTVYLLQVLRRNLTAADTRAIAKDYLNPGTPTTTVGSFTAFSYDEIAYQFAAAGNALTTTLDLTASPLRYKPRYKITAWTAAAPKLVWGGAELVAGTDYRYTVDAANHVLYLQVYSDIVASGAGSGQRNNAALVITDATVSLSGTLSSGSGLSAALGVTRPLAGSLVSGAALSGTLSNGHRLQGTIPSGSSLAGALSVGSPTLHLQGTLPSSLGCSGSLSISRPLQGSLSGQGSLAGTLQVSLLHGTLPSSAGCSGRLTIGRKLAGAIPSGAACAGVLTIGQPTVHLTAAIPSGGGVAGRLTISRPLASTVSAGAGLGGVLKLTSNLTATLLALTLADSALASLLLADVAPAALVLADVEGA